MCRPCSLCRQLGGLTHVAPGSLAKVRVSRSPPSTGFQGPHVACAEWCQEGLTSQGVACKRGRILLLLPPPLPPPFLRHILGVLAGGWLKAGRCWPRMRCPAVATLSFSDLEGQCPRQLVPLC